MAASFDCAQATTMREKLICRDRSLSDLDTRLARLYRERRGLLSRNGAEQLRLSQASWIGFIDIICPSNPPEHAFRSRPQVQCLDARYRERLDQLSEVGRKLGPFVINRIDHYAAYLRLPRMIPGVCPDFTFGISPTHRLTILRLP
ncbi:lysozyme inhibitor LprI family protein [Methylosinus sp. LW4]|uniref:lysozyme inhibitor LprI family protein n=1 Tax=Methylosinus sp. LW4 TaxID=136993 RepID=UPI0035276445